MHNSAILSLILMESRKFILISTLLIFLTFINIFYDSAFSSENKTLKYIFEPFLKLNGTDFYDIENNDQLQLEEFTLATWFRTNQSCSCEPSHIVNKGGFNNERPGKNMNYGVWMNTDGTITAGFESERGKNFEILSQKKYNDGKWHYAVVLYNSTVLRVDIDGNTIGNLKISKTPDTKGNQPLRVGANSLDLDKYFNGEVDEVRIWNRGLAINELSEIYTNRNFTTNGQVQYLDFGKNIINNDKDLIYNNSITKSTKEFQTTLGTTKQPQFIFVFVIPKDILQELESGATKKQHPPIVENNTQTVKNDTSKTNNTKEELLATLTNKKQPPTIVENQTSSKPITTTNKKQPPTIVENQTSSKPITTTNKKQPPTIVENQTSSKPITTTNKKQPPTIVENQTSSKPITTTNKKQLPTIVENQTSSKPITTTNKKQPPTIVENQTSSKPITTTNKKQPPTIVENQTSNRIMTEPTLLSNNTSNNANVKSDKINLVFENLSVNRSVTNSVEIKGEIKNNTPLDLQEIKISAEYYNKTGTLLAKVEHFITSPSYILKPNQLISFNILEVLGFGFDKLGDYNIFASGESIN